VHGGYGYTRDYDVEQFYRDNRLNPIHEGTHGIQALDLLGRKATMFDGAGLALLLATIGATTARAAEAGGAAAEFGALLDVLRERIAKTTAVLHADRDAIGNATPYLEAVGHVVVAWMWLEQLLATAGKDGDFYDGKRAAARYFFRWELPKAHGQLDLLDSLDRTVLDVLPHFL
jgi:butyryl-CoA dehydrogenase